MINNILQPVYPNTENEKKATSEVVMSINQSLLPKKFDKICMKSPEYKIEFCFDYMEGFPGVTAIHRAISLKNYKLANHIALKSGSENVDVVDGNRKTSFRLLCELTSSNFGVKNSDEWNLIKTLLSMGANVNYGKINSNLKLAANSKDVRFTALLLDFGAKKLPNDSFSGHQKDTYETAREIAEAYNEKKCLLVFNFSSSLPKELIAEISSLFKEIQFNFVEKK